MPAEQDDELFIFGGLLVAALVVFWAGKGRGAPLPIPEPPKPTYERQLSKGELVLLATKWGFPDPNLAAAVAMGESGGNPRALNPGTATRPEHSVGLWQINQNAHRSKGYTDEQLFDPDTNAKIAKEIYDEAGGSWKPWGAYTNGSYKKYL